MLQIIPETPVECYVVQYNRYGFGRVKFIPARVVKETKPFVYVEVIHNGVAIEKVFVKEKHFNEEYVNPRAYGSQNIKERGYKYHDSANYLTFNIEWVAKTKKEQKERNQKEMFNMLKDAVKDFPPRFSRFCCAGYFGKTAGKLILC